VQSGRQLLIFRIKFDSVCFALDTARKLYMMRNMISDPLLWDLFGKFVIYDTNATFVEVQKMRFLQCNISTIFISPNIDFIHKYTYLSVVVSLPMTDIYKI
jgi:hypothetical protein